MKAVGVREFTGHLSGALSLGKALDAAQTETRRYAKRQSTFMRGRLASWPRLDAVDTDGQWTQLVAAGMFSPGSRRPI
jgi:tRNA dimethylallyltransferase